MPLRYNIKYVLAVCNALCSFIDSQSVCGLVFASLWLILWLTVLESRSIVVDISQAYCDGGGGGVTAAEAKHILHLHHHQVLLSGLAVHVWPRCYNNPCRWGEGQISRQQKTELKMYLLVCFLYKINFVSIILREHFTIINVKFTYWIDP